MIVINKQAEALAIRQAVSDVLRKGQEAGARGQHSYKASFKLPNSAYDVLKFLRYEGINCQDKGLSTTKLDDGSYRYDAELFFVKNISLEYRCKAFFNRLIRITNTYFLSDYVEDIVDFITSDGQDYISMRDMLRSMCEIEGLDFHQISCDVASKFMSDNRLEDDIPYPPDKLPKEIKNTNSSRAIIKWRTKVNGEWATMYHSDIIKSKDLGQNNIYSESIYLDIDKAAVFYDKDEALRVIDMFMNEFHIGQIIEKK
jgi:hypothetical protein